VKWWVTKVANPANFYRNATNIWHTQVMSGKSPIAATPVAFVQAILQAYRRYGISPDSALKKAQIEPRSISNPQAHITALQMQVISGAAMQELNDEALGWFSRPLPWGTYGMLARASISAPNLQVALTRWCRHHGLVASDISVELVVTDTLATLQITERCDLRDFREFCLVSVLRNIYGVACWLINSRIALLTAQFPFAPPLHAAAYDVLFTRGTQFGAGKAAISFDARYLSLALRRDEKALRQMLQNALPLTVLQYRRDRLLVQQVRQSLCNHPDLTHSAEGLAALLNVSPRTLHRQLRDEGASLQAIKDQVRQERAVELLLRTTKPIKQVAQAVGFQNEKSFIRAFKAWTTKTPAEFRAS
jgi:AraC-like DNA-binding protein